MRSLSQALRSQRAWEGQRTRLAAPGSREEKAFGLTPRVMRDDGDAGADDWGPAQD